MLSYKLRPHHVLCISFFEGKGYNPEFVKNMKEVIKSFDENAIVQLTDSVDIICAACPNNNANRCEDDFKVKRYDEAVLSICHLKSGQMLLWQELNEIVNARIIKSGKLHSVCGDCKWSSICLQKGNTE